MRRERRAALAPSPSPVEEDQTAWLLTFSDLVMQLFAFVLVMSALGGAARSGATPAPAAAAPAPAPVALPTSLEAEAVRLVARPAAPANDGPPAVVVAAPAAPPAADRLAELAQRMQAIADAAGRHDDVSVQVRDSDLVVTLAETISFASGSAELLSTAAPILQEVGRLADEKPDLDVEVTGYTDDRPIHTGAFPSNLELSLARAARVVREITANRPALAERTIAAGLGEHRPVAANDDEAGRARNRRVDVRLVPRAQPVATVSAGR